MFDNLPSSIEHIPPRSRLRGIGMNSRQAIGKRFRTVPIGETVPGYEVDVWNPGS